MNGNIQKTFAVLVHASVRVRVCVCVCVLKNKANVS